MCDRQTDRDREEKVEGKGQGKEEEGLRWGHVVEILIDMVDIKSKA